MEPLVLRATSLVKVDDRVFLRVFAPYYDSFLYSLLFAWKREFRAGECDREKSIAELSGNLVATARGGGLELRAPLSLELSKGTLSGHSRELLSFTSKALGLSIVVYCRSEGCRLGMRFSAEKWEREVYLYLHPSGHVESLFPSGGGVFVSSLSSGGPA